ncbi:hypothetical protein ACSGB8_004716, partial [Escherichia coli]
KTCCIVIKVEPCRHVLTPRAGYLTPDHCLVTRSIALHSVGWGEGMKFRKMNFSGQCFFIKTF